MGQELFQGLGVPHGTAGFLWDVIGDGCILPQSHGEQSCTCCCPPL